MLLFVVFRFFMDGVSHQPSNAASFISLSGSSL